MAMTKTSTTSPLRWTKGDERRFAAGAAIKVYAGLYFYHGFGYGEYFSSDGFVYWGNSSDARGMAKAENVTMHYIDAFTGYRPVYLGD